MMNKTNNIFHTLSIKNSNALIKSLSRKIEKNESYFDHEVFKILEKQVFDENKAEFIRELKQGTKLYRARVIRSIDKYASDNGVSVDIETGITTGYNESNSREAPLFKSDAGRCNTEGASYLYVAEDPVTACEEIKPSITTLISLAEFNVVQTMKVVDFSDEKLFPSNCCYTDGTHLPSFFTDIMFAYCKPKVEDEDYRISQILTDFIRKHGVDGICYSSFFTDGINHTIFNSCKRNLAFNGSRVVHYKRSAGYFWDYNNRTMLHKEWEYEDDQEKATEQLQRIADSLGHSVM